MDGPMLTYDLKSFLQAHRAWVRDGSPLDDKPELVYSFWRQLKAASPALAAWARAYYDEVAEAITKPEERRLLGVADVGPLALPPLPPAMLVPPPTQLMSSGAAPAPTPRPRPFRGPCDAPALERLLRSKATPAVSRCVLRNALLLSERRRDDLDSGLVFAGGAPTALAYDLESAFADLDVFVVSADPEEAQRLVALWKTWAKNELKEAVMAAGKNARCLVNDEDPGVVNVHVDSPGLPCFTMQLVTSPRHSVSQVLYNFDLKCCQAAFDGEQLLMTPAFVQTALSGAEVVDPYKDRNGRYARRLLKYMLSYRLSAWVPGWDPEVLDALAVGTWHPLAKLKAIAAHLHRDGRGAVFALLYNAVRAHGRAALGPTSSDDAAYRGLLRDPKGRPGSLHPAHGLDGRDADAADRPWFDGGVLGFLVRELQGPRFEP